MGPCPIVNNSLPIAQGEEGLFVAEIIDALYESTSTGRPVKMEGSI
jgi:predicted dehydrogenase